MWYNFFCLSNCVECICERSKCDAFCLSTFVVASFSTRLLLTVESCYRPIGDEKCVQKLTDKNREFENLRMTTILYYTTANTTVCIVFTLFISFTSDAVKIVYAFRDYVYHSICIGHVYKKNCVHEKVMCDRLRVFSKLTYIYPYKIGGDRLRIFDRCVWNTFINF